MDGRGGDAVLVLVLSATITCCERPIGSGYGPPGGSQFIFFTIARFIVAPDC